MKLPTLYSESKSGTLRQWRVWTNSNKIYMEYGQVGGQLQTNYREVEGKNIGKSNETTPKQQAEKEAQSLWDRKLKGKYFETKKEAQELTILPMLAKSYDPSRVEFPCDVQRKKDGVRCMAYWKDGNIVLMSRGNTQYEHCHEVSEQLEDLLPKGGILDGELYRHGKSLQQIYSLIRRRQSDTKQIGFHAFDYISFPGNDTPWGNRKRDLNILALEDYNNLHRVRSYHVTRKEDIVNHHNRFVKEGYEGAIIRNRSGIYYFGHRSKGILKYKDFKDDEFEIVDYSEGSGRLRGTVLWICDIGDGRTIEVTPQGSLERRAELFENADDYIGQMLKVRYPGVTDDGVPKHFTGISIRPKEDL